MHTIKLLWSTEPAKKTSFNVIKVIPDRKKTFKTTVLKLNKYATTSK